MADSALQAVVAFSLFGDRGGDAPARPAVPLELRELVIFGPCAARMWAWARRVASPDKAGDGFGVYDVDLCDQAGDLRASFRGLVMRPLAEQADLAGAATPKAASDRLGPTEASPLDLVLAPSWEPVAADGVGPAPDRDQAGPVAVVGGSDDDLAGVRERFPDARTLPVSADDDVEALGAALAALSEDGPGGRLRHLIWFVPEDATASADDDALIAAQDRGVRFGFRLLRALLGEGYDTEPLTWSVITTGTQAVLPDEAGSPAHAGLHGFLGSLAREQEGWSVRALDLPPSGERPWDEVFALAADPGDGALALRDGGWLRRALKPRAAAAVAPSAAPPGAVIVVIGGAGGVGAVWSEEVLRRHPVQLVWIGRRPEDDAVRAARARLGELGPAPVYLRADAADRDQLGAAREAVLERFGRIDGLVHSTVALHDRTLANMTEAELDASLSAKVDTSVRLAQVFGQDAPGFALFFSSIAAFARWPGQANYVAGCAFVDAFARRLAAEWPGRVRVMSWGSWGGTGVAASDPARSRMARKGLGAIEPAGAMAALDSLLAGPDRHLAYLRVTGPEVLADLGVRQEELSAAVPVGDRDGADEPAEAVSSAAEVLALMDQPRERVAEHLVGALRGHVAEILALDPETLDTRSRPFVDASLGEFGMDSLSSNTLRNTLRRELGVDLPVNRIIGDTVDGIVQALYEQLLLQYVGSGPAPEDEETTETFVF